MTEATEERQEISQDEVARYTESKYKVVTVIPYIEKPVRIVRIVNQEALDELLDGYREYAEFIVNVSIQEGTT